MNKIQPIFHYVLLNHQFIDESTVLKALLYQHQLFYKKKRWVSFPKVLIALNVLSPKDYQQLQDFYGPMQEEPLFILLRDEGYLSEKECSVFQAEAEISKTYPAENSNLSPNLVFELLSHKLNQPSHSFSVSIMKVLKTRGEVMRKIKSLLLQLGYLSPESIKHLMPTQPYLPLKLKPLGDVLVLQGLLKEQDLLSTLVERVVPEKEPLIHILRSHFELWQINRIRGVLSNAELTGKNLAMGLVETGYISFGELIQKVQSTYSYVSPYRVLQAS